MIVVSGIVQVAPSDHAAAAELMKTLAAETAKEAGSISYAFYADLETEGKFRVFENGRATRQWVRTSPSRTCPRSWGALGALECRRHRRSRQVRGQRREVQVDVSRKRPTIETWSSFRCGGSGVVAVMDELSDGSGWLTFDPAFDERFPPPSADDVGRLMSGRGPAIPRAKWVPADTSRRRP